MALGPDRPSSGPVVAEGYDQAAERLLEAIASACRSREDFEGQVEAALRATLALFAAEPELGILLTVDPFAGDEAALVCYRRWRRRWGDLLRDAAVADLGADGHPTFLEPTLVDGICERISRRLRAGEGECLEDLLPGLLELVRACYLQPQRSQGGGDSSRR